MVEYRVETVYRCKKNSNRPTDLFSPESEDRNENHRNDWRHELGVFY